MSQVGMPMVDPRIKQQQLGQMLQRPAQPMPPAGPQMMNQQNPDWMAAKAMGRPPNQMTPPPPGGAPMAPPGPMPGMGSGNGIPNTQFPLNPSPQVIPPNFQGGPQMMPPQGANGLAPGQMPMNPGMISNAPRPNPAGLNLGGGLGLGGPFR